MVYHSISCKHKSSFTPYNFLQHPPAKKLNLTFEIFENGQNKMEVFFCFLAGKSIFRSVEFQKLLKSKHAKAKLVRMLRDQSRQGVKSFLKHICVELDISNKKRKFFVVRFYEGQYWFETWEVFL